MDAFFAILIHALNAALSVFFTLWLWNDNATVGAILLMAGSAVMIWATIFAFWRSIEIRKAKRCAVYDYRFSAKALYRLTILLMLLYLLTIAYYTLLLFQVFQPFFTIRPALYLGDLLGSGTIDLMGNLKFPLTAAGHAALTVICLAVFFAIPRPRAGGDDSDSLKRKTKPSTTWIETKASNKSSQIPDPFAISAAMDKKYGQFPLPRPYMPDSKTGTPLYNKNQFTPPITKGRNMTTSPRLYSPPVVTRNYAGQHQSYNVPWNASSQQPQSQGRQQQPHSSVMSQFGQDTANISSPTYGKWQQGLSHRLPSDIYISEASPYNKFEKDIDSQQGDDTFVNMYSYDTMKTDESKFSISHYNQLASLPQPPLHYTDSIYSRRTTTTTNPQSIMEYVSPVDRTTGSTYYSPQVSIMEQVNARHHQAYSQFFCGDEDDDASVIGYPVVGNNDSCPPFPSLNTSSRPYRVPSSMNRSSPRRSPTTLGQWL